MSHTDLSMFPKCEETPFFIGFRTSSFRKVQHPNVFQQNSLGEMISAAAKRQTLFLWQRHISMSKNQELHSIIVTKVVKRNGHTTK